MNQKNFKKTDAESIHCSRIASNDLKIPFVQRARHHSESNDSPFNAYSDLFNITTDYNLGIDGSNVDFIENRLSKLGSSAPNDNSWFFNNNANDYSPNETDKSLIINSDYSDLSDDDAKSSLKSFKNSFKSKFSRTKKTSQSSKLQNSDDKNNRLFSKSNFLQLPSKQSFSSSTGNIDLQITNEQSTGRKAKRSNKPRKRERCYSMDERRNLKNDLNSPFSFDNLAYNDKENNLSDISEPSLSSSERSEKSIEDLKKIIMFNNKSKEDQDLDGCTQQQNTNSQTPIILINSRLESDCVKFDLNGDEDDKNEDKDYLLKSEFKSSKLDIELGSNESDEDLSDKNIAIEFTTKLASDLSKPEIDSESLVSFVFQVLFPLLICGLGNLIAGILLNNIESYEVFKEINQLYIAIPCLMGLKGNLEMTMASRLSTAANLGILEHLPQILSITKSNICLIQCQATVVSLLASLYGVFEMIREKENVNINQILLLISSNVITSNIACVVLSTLMIGIILFCKHKSINPDNVATPIASSLGDVSTVFLIGITSSYLFECLESNNYWLNPTILFAILIVTPFSTVVAFRNKHTKKILKFGWCPIILSMCLSNGAGIILDKAVKLFKGFALFQPIVNGVGGNLSAIQASRISTYLHKTQKFGQLPVKELRTIDSKILDNFNNGFGQTLTECKNSESNFSETSYIQLNEINSELKDIDLNDDVVKDDQTGNENFINHQSGVISASTAINDYLHTPSIGQTECFNQAFNQASKTRKLLRIRRKKIKNYLKIIFSSGSIHGKCAKLLILITLPMHVLYFYLIRLIEDDNQSIPGRFPFFIFFYLMVAFTQMSTLLYLAKVLVYFLWKHKFDPDTWVIPLLTAIGDLAGTSLLALIFYIFSNSID